MFLQNLPMPPDADLRKLLRFSSQDGLIWLSGQRMLLLHSASLMALHHTIFMLGGNHLFHDDDGHSCEFVVRVNVEICV